MTGLDDNSVVQAVSLGLERKGRILERTSVKVDLRKERVSHWPFAPTDYYPTGSYGLD